MNKHLSVHRGNLSDYISQVFVIHESGVVFLCRRYDQGCFSEETQLIGGFLGALLNFVELKTKERTCQKDPKGYHTLEEIQMTCSNWLIRKHEDCFIVLISETGSVVSQFANRSLKEELLNQTITAIDIIKSFQDMISDHIFLDHSDEFGIILDNMYNESLSSYFNIGNAFQSGSQMQGLGNSIFTTSYSL